MRSQTSQSHSGPPTSGGATDTAPGLDGPIRRLLRRARKKYTAEQVLQMVSVALELPEPTLRYNGRPLSDYRAEIKTGTFYVDDDMCDLDGQSFNYAAGPHLRGIGHRTVHKPVLRRREKIYFPQSRTGSHALEFVNFCDPKYQEALLRYRLRYVEMFGFPPSEAEIRWYLEDLQIGMFEYDPNAYDFEGHGPNCDCLDCTMDPTYRRYSAQSIDQITYPSTFYKGGQLDPVLVDRYKQLKKQYDYYYSAPNPVLLGPRPQENLFKLAVDNAPIVQYPMLTPYGTLVQPFLNVTPTVSPVVAPAPSIMPAAFVTKAPALNLFGSSVSPTSPPTMVTSSQATIQGSVPAAAFGNRNLRYVPQATDSLHVEAIEQTHDKEQILTFSDDTTNWVESILHSKDNSFYASDTGDVSLADFFMRPIKIAQFAWAVGAPTPFYQSMDPWSLFFTNSRVVNRIVNYKNLKCNLKVKIIINGSQFHFGRLMASYNPLEQALDDFTRNRGLAPWLSYDLIEASQRPHLYLDPCTSQGGTMELPFFYYTNALDISLAEWNRMGVLTLQQLTPLKHCQGVIDNVTVSVFAWATDVVLSSPTGIEPGGLVPQARDEYAPNGLISRPAAVLASVAGKLKKAPIIGPYASAAEIGAGAISEVAKAFGYCKPNVVTDPIMVKQELVTTLANTNRADAISKLTFDAKANVTVDPRTVGLGPVDEMSLASIASRESYLTSFPWAISTLPEARLFNIAVTPSLWNAVQLNSTSPTELHMTPSAFAALPFRWWRGTMRFRFQVVCSSFHKGRLRFVYDPIQQDPSTAIPEYNTNMAHVVDISLENDFILEVAWNSNYTYLQCLQVNNNSTSLLYSSTVAVNGITGFTNGILSCYVMNQLTSSGIGVNNDISVNVFTSASEDFEVFDPLERSMQPYAYFPQSMTVNTHSEASTHSMIKNLEDPNRDAPEGAVVIRTFGKPLDVSDGTGIICHGDPVVSIRSLIKRYTYCESFAPTTAGLIDFRVITSAFPKYKATAPAAIHLNGPTPYNYTHMTPLNYFAPAFAGRRGGLRNKFVLISQTPTVLGAYGRLTRSIQQTHVQTDTVIPTATSATYSLAMKTRVNNLSSGWAGSSLAPLSTQPVIEGEIPFHNRLRFFPARYANITAAESFGQGMLLEAIIPTSATTATYFDRYVAAADDYSLFWFIATPIIYYDVNGFN